MQSSNVISGVCPGCAVTLPPIDGAVHRYMESSAACWAKFGELLAREYESRDYAPAHHLTVDAYAVQHPGKPSPQTIQSVAVHLISLHAMLELGVEHRIAQHIKKCADRGRFTWLDPPQGPAEITILHPLAAPSADTHLIAVKDWATAAWRAWAPHHDQIRVWAATYVK
jgi:hypothetical protein